MSGPKITLTNLTSSKGRTSLIDWRAIGILARLLFRPVPRLRFLSHLSPFLLKRKHPHFGLLPEQECWRYMPMGTLVLVTRFSPLSGFAIGQVKISPRVHSKKPYRRYNPPLLYKKQKCFAFRSTLSNIELQQ